MKQQEMMKIYRTCVTKNSAYEPYCEVCQSVPEGTATWQSIDRETHYSDGRFVLDPDRPDGADKLQASADLRNGNIGAAMAEWTSALEVESDDAEPLIYLEDQRVLASGSPFITFVVNITFSNIQPDGRSRGIYRTYTSCRHALCNVHHQRELTFVHETLQQDWADEMSQLLTWMHEAVQEAKQQGKSQLDPREVADWKSRYQALLRRPATRPIRRLLLPTKKPAKPDDANRVRPAICLIGSPNTRMPSSAFWDTLLCLLITIRPNGICA